MKTAIPVIVIGFLSLVHSTSANAQYGMAGGMDAQAFSSGFGNSSPLDMAKAKLMNAKSPEQQAKCLESIKRELSKEYDQYLSFNKQQVDAMQERLDRLKVQLKKRQDARDELVSLEVKRILNESRGLSWPSTRPPVQDHGSGMGLSPAMQAYDSRMGLSPEVGLGMASDWNSDQPFYGREERATPASPEPANRSQAPQPFTAPQNADTPNFSAPQPISPPQLSSLEIDESRTLYTGSKEADSPVDAEAAGLRQLLSAVNLKQIALACHNFHDAHKTFPEDIVDINDEPMLSWRVSILPFIGHKELFEKFHLDEPWNSEHNIELLTEMPDVFKSDNFGESMKTLFQGFSSKGAIFEPSKDISFSDMLDGSSNTILCIEADDDLAVFWTKPQDLEASGDNIKELFRFGRDNLPRKVDSSGNSLSFCHAVLCDGSVQQILETAKYKDLKPLITYADGTVVRLEAITAE